MKRAYSIPEEEFLDLYLKEISQYKPMKSDEEAKLAKGIKKGNKEALEKLVQANLRFVVSVARNYQNQGMALIDLINEGNLGLIKAAKRFDEKKNFKFISYAVWWIRQAILQALAEQSRIVNVPLHRVGLIHKIGRAEERLEQRYGRDPDFDEIADELSLDIGNIKDSLRIGNRHLSLNAPFDTGDDASMIDLLRDDKNDRPDEEIMDKSYQENVKKNLDILTSREKDIVRLYFGLGDELPHTLDQIGERLNLTRERVRQIKESALKRLREESSLGHLKDYVPKSMK
ncbi:MAG: sigma-70 family RNA polymerase sigma factor [Chitinivibrionales bacterium]|nr:sigma-70 family RNA polymerase sigma factor [Chitinivibrionales bacterium]